MKIIIKRGKENGIPLIILLMMVIGVIVGVLIVIGIFMWILLIDESNSQII
jgi:hypothetical protein